MVAYRRFENKVAVVTGGSSGIGLATTIRLAQEGATVIAVDVREAQDDLVPSIEEGRVVFEQADVSSASEMQRTLDSCVARFGGIDILFNNAGYAIAQPIDEIAEDDWEQLLKVNVTGVFHGCKYALPHMVARGQGVIVNTASTFGLIAQPLLGAYCTSKSAVIGLTRQVALDYARHGIRCNCVCPGPTFTPNIRRHYGELENLNSRGRYLLSTVPLGRMANPEDIAAAVTFLASDDASFITGTALVVDGGQTIHTGPVWRTAEAP